MLDLQVFLRIPPKIETAWGLTGTQIPIEVCVKLAKRSQPANYMEGVMQEQEPEGMQF